jgi:hypothetical protein
MYVRAEHEFYKWCVTTPGEQGTTWILMIQLQPWLSLCQHWIGMSRNRVLFPAFNHKLGGEGERGSVNLQMLDVHIQGHP